MKNYRREYEECVNATIESLLLIMLSSRIHPCEYRLASVVPGHPATEGAYVQGA
jgi:hypothetical protein